MSNILHVFKDDILRTSGSDDVILICHHGSRVRGEAHSDSDYDTILVLNEIDEEVITKIRELASSNRDLSVLTWIATFFPMIQL